LNLERTNVDTAIPPLYQLAFLRGDLAGMAKAAARSAGDPGAEDELLSSCSRLLGQLASANAMASTHRLSAARRAEFSRHETSFEGT
jgi:hypothetical protein